jgi:hypothetical protein
MRLSILPLLPLLVVIGCGPGGSPRADPREDSRGKTDGQPVIPKPVSFKPAMLQFIAEGKKLARPTDKVPELAVYRKNQEKVKNLFDQVPAPPSRFEETQYKAAKQTLKSFEAAEGLLDLVHQALEGEAQAEADMRLDQFKQESRDILKKLQEIETALKK